MIPTSAVVPELLLVAVRLLELALKLVLRSSWTAESFVKVIPEIVIEVPISIRFAL
jgi:hypothetical protein